MEQLHAAQLMQLVDVLHESVIGHITMRRIDKAQEVEKLRCKVLTILIQQRQQ